jgi:hypothetical protein
MPTLDLTDEEREALIRFLRDGIDRNLPSSEGVSWK